MLKAPVGNITRFERKSTRDEEFEQSRRVLPKNRIAKTSGSGDPLSRSPVHADGRDGVRYYGGASRERWKP
jgi:hypothetical protein